VKDLYNHSFLGYLTTLFKKMNFYVTEWNKKMIMQDEFVVFLMRWLLSFEIKAQ
jgi:hypothetical protein